VTAGELVGQYGVAKARNGYGRWYCHVLEAHSSGKFVRVTFFNPRRRPTWIPAAHFTPHEKQPA
jgi:hypothetical protein